MRIILGSSSPWRAEIMRTIVPDFEVMSADIDEKSIRFTSPVALTGALARAKSEALRPRITGEAILITADQVVTCMGDIREKPRDADEARRWLRSYREMPVICINAVLGYNTVTKHDQLIFDEAKVWLRGLTDAAIEHIIRNTDAMLCSGACAAGRREWGRYVRSIRGGRDGLFGLPRKLTKMLIEDLSQA